MSRDKIRVLFVCLGNICRSPLAEGVFRHLVKERGLAEHFEIDSAGTGSWHVGEPPDRRMRETARRHGVSLDGQRARQFEEEDLQRFDHIFAMDRNNLHDILYYDRQDRFGNKVRLFREFDPDPGDYQVPDPYYGGPQGFENVYRIVERTARTLLDRLAETYRLEGHAA
ncbi:MAG: low molecular weight phosphotyrosine protein phosphatase [Bacteroidetes bacterium]|nr:MAG: low molecular weight phosphotyrosine protein phosphatase [Bacteroidota bacterium]